MFEKSIFWRSFDEQKDRVKLYGSKRAFKQEISFYTAQSEAVVVVVELFKRGHLVVGGCF